jgi:hypothetical protein
MTFRYLVLLSRYPSLPLHSQTREPWENAKFAHLALKFIVPWFQLPLVKCFQSNHRYKQEQRTCEPSLKHTLCCTLMTMIKRRNMTKPKCRSCNLSLMVQASLLSLHGISASNVPTHTPRRRPSSVNDDLALVVLGALVVVVACSAEGRNSYADTEVAELRLHRSAEAWAPVALPEVLVTVLSADGARLPWHRDESALFAVAA